MRTRSDIGAQAPAMPLLFLPERWPEWEPSVARAGVYVAESLLHGVVLGAAVVRGRTGGTDNRQRG